MMSTLAALVAAFVEESVFAQPWRDLDFEESEDCDVVTAAFVAYASERGLDVEAVKVEMTSPLESMLGEHWFALVDGVAIDFTARQFHNVAGMPLSAAQIPIPLVFLWPGEYPLPTLTAEEVTS